MIQLPGIRQSDMAAFRKCRRSWDWSSGLRHNLTPKESVTHFWIGTGCHFALEDYHGLNYFGDPRPALEAYATACGPSERPENWVELVDLGQSILSYYLEDWLPRRDTFQTLFVEGKPQVEVNWRLPLPGVQAEMSGTFDRIVTDEYSRIWVADYKFMGKIDTAKLDNDPQVSAYLWAARQLYGPVEGLVYIQFLKKVAEGPTRLKSGEFSQAKAAGVTFSSYQRALLDQFGEIPEKYQSHLNWIAMQEDSEGDLLIRRTRVRRNEHAIAAQDWALRAQGAEMVFPGISIYPNPSRDCTYCSFRRPCLALDEGSDFESMLSGDYLSRDLSANWRGRIEWP